MKVYASQTMRVSAKGEYAARAVLHLAMEYPEVATIHQIAACHRIPVKYLEQILLELKRGGILTSRRGVHGGYLLSRRPEEIFVGEVLQVVDGRFTESSCAQREQGRGFSSPDSTGCGLQQVWADIRVAVESILFETSFADVCARSLRRPPAADCSKTPARLNA